MPQFRKKVTTVDAVQVPMPAEKPQWLITVITGGQLWELTDRSVRMKGGMLVRHGDWIVRESSGEIRPYSAEAFAISYEPV